MIHTERVRPDARRYFGPYLDLGNRSSSAELHQPPSRYSYKNLFVRFHLSKTKNRNAGNHPRR